jgi:predicted nicotinamide N-methyase
MSTDPLRASLAEQLARLRGSGGAPVPDAVLDIVSEQVAGVGVIRPRDWDELRHVEGGAGRGVPYWALLWPSGRALASELAGRDLAGLRVLELGCGLGAPSVVAAQRGARVLAVDSSSDAVAFSAHNLALNDLEGDVALLDWTAPDALAGGAPWDLVIAADILYTQHNAQALVRVLPQLVGSEGSALIADPRRAGARDFLAAARGMFELSTRPAPRHEGVALHTLRRRPHPPGGRQDQPH